MAHKIVWMNEKGGVGKSTLCFNTAWALAETGKKVLMVDFDSQRSNLSFFAGASRSDSVATMYDVLVEKESIKKCVLVIEEGLHLIPATDSTAMLTKQQNKYTANDFKKAISEIEFYYDYIFIDVSPSFEVAGAALALSISDYIMVPMLLDVTSLNSVKGIYESVQSAKRINPNIKMLGLVVNQHNWTRTLSRKVKDAGEALAKKLGTEMFETKIRVNAAIAEAVNIHEGVTKYNPKSNGATDIQNLVAELERKVNQ